MVSKSSPGSGVIHVSELTSIFLPMNTKNVPMPINEYALEPRVYAEMKKVSTVTMRITNFRHEKCGLLPDPRHKRGIP